MPAVDNAHNIHKPTGVGPLRVNAPAAWVIAAILFGAALRLTTLGDVPPGLNQDEAVNGYDAYSLFITGRDHHGHPFPFAGLESFGDWASPLLTFLTAPAVGLFGLRADVVRSVPAVVGVLAIPVMYRLGVELFKRPFIGVVAAWYIALSPWAVHRSRFANPGAIVPAMAALTLLVLIWTANRRSARGIVAVAIASGLTMATYPTLKLYVPLLLLAAFLVYGKAVRRLKREALFHAAVVFLIIAGPIMYLSLLDPGGRARLQQVSAFQSGNFSVAFAAKQYLSYFSPSVFFIGGNGHAGQSATPPGLGIELRSALPFLLAGFLWLLVGIVRPTRPTDRQSALFLLSALALYPVPGSLTQPAPHLTRALHLIPLLGIVAAVGATAITDLARRWCRNTPVRIRSSLVALPLLLALVPISLELFARYEHYFNKYARREDVLDYFQYGLDSALGYVRAHAADYDAIWVTDTNQPYIYVLFYSSWPPSDVHQGLQVQRNPPEFNEVTMIGKYHFGDPPRFKLDEPSLLFTVYDPIGRAVYEVRGGETLDHQKIMLVRRP
jgi:4-amino-4-deoxy-L-arabinose transferase-like glycosyltransferase